MKRETSTGCEGRALELDAASNDPIDLMKRYQEQRDVDTRNELVMYYSYIARSVATQMRGISTNYAQMEDIVNQGVLTLIDCVEKFDPAKGIKFESYAFMRVKGAVIDFVRKQDWLPRRVRLTAKQIASAHDALCSELMREPTQKELADRLGISIDQLAKHYSEISNSVMLSFEGLIQNVSQMGEALEDVSDEESGAENNIFRQELRDTLRGAIDSLTERERLVVTLYYYEHLKLSDISKILGVSDQRVSQINSRAIKKLKSVMEQYMKG